MTNKELVRFVKDKIGTEYVYGMKGKVMTEQNFKHLQKTYGSNLVWNKDAEKIGQVCVDCSGLIYWATKIHFSSTQLYKNATHVESINTIHTAPIGALVWMNGHVGVYVGMKNGEPYYVAADGSAYGVREAKVANNSFTHWLLMEYISYEKEEDMVEESTMIVNGQEVVVNRILNKGSNFIKIRDIADVMGYTIGFQGSTAVLTKK